jgi:hypothetical protein
MYDLQSVKVVQITPPGAIVDNAAFTTATLDTRGFGEVLFIVNIGALDIAIAALKLQESDASNMASATDITGADFSVSPLTLPIDTADNTNIQIHVRLGANRKRYMDISVTGGDGSAGSYVSILAILGRGSADPSTAALAGAGQRATV